MLTVPGKDRILGVTIVGEHAADLLAEYVLAMKHGIGLEQDPRHDPHLPDACRGQQVRRRRLEARAPAGAAAALGGALPCLAARLTGGRGAPMTIDYDARSRRHGR